ncbi:MAG: sulfite exporter TauE/SafE family protein [Desulfoplanes sp.]|nr:sulfite exporter TauE/SafE family protein [Desulfoplanes sp.]
MLTVLIMYLLLGSVAGFLAGLLGIGGGLVIVPMLTFMFTSQGLPPEHILHLALGTSLASIMFTSVSSMRAHNKHGAVLWPTFWKITPGIIIGTLLGTWIAAQLSTNFLKIFFACFLYYVALKMLLNIRPKPNRELPSSAGITTAGGIIGILSSLVGIGGGTLSVPFLTWCNVPMHKAIGTSAAIGFPIAVAGAVGYLANGLMAQGLPSPCFGFIHLTALATIVVASISTAPLGAKTAHSLPVPKLKKFFALLLLFMATRMVWSLF